MNMHEFISLEILRGRSDPLDPRTPQAAGSTDPFDPAVPTPMLNSAPEIEEET